MKVFISTPRLQECFVLGVNSGDTVAILKKMIQRHLNVTWGYHLFFKDEELAEDHRTVKSCKIRDRCLLWFF